MENHKLSTKTIRAIGDDLIEKYFSDNSWLYELAADLASIVTGDSDNEVPLFAKNTETIDVRCKLKTYITERFQNIMRRGYGMKPKETLGDVTLSLSGPTGDNGINDHGYSFTATKKPKSEMISWLSPMMQQNNTILSETVRLGKENEALSSIDLQTISGIVSASTRALSESTPSLSNAVDLNVSLNSTNN